MTDLGTSSAPEEEYRRYKIEDYSTCYYCKSTGLVKERDDFCPNCRFPQSGSDREMGRFLLRMTRKEEEIEEENKKLKNGRYILYAIGGLNLLVGLFFTFQGGSYMTDESYFEIISRVLLAGSFIGLGVWSRSKPFEAFIAGLAIYVVLIMLTLLIDPASAFRGFIMKGLIIAGLVYGIKASKEVKELEADLQPLREPKNFTQNDL